MKNFNPIIFFACSLIACNDSIKYSAIKYPDGGYDYPKHVADKDTNFYYYPLKDIMPKQDSLRYTSTYLLFKEFDELNLSLKSTGQDVFRLQYGTAFGGYYIITITKNFIRVKKEISNDEHLFHQNKLSEDEQKIYRIFSYHYPFDNLDKYMQMYIDSIKSVNPKVLQPEYFVYLTNKTFEPDDSKKIYAAETIKITDKDFNHLVETINKSGYWKMPYELKCEDPPTDGSGYGLEANTKTQYNFVTATDCAENNKTQIDFANACKEIIKLAKLEKKINIWSGGKMSADSL